jgi:hypothetical protein
MFEQRCGINVCEHAIRFRERRAKLAPEFGFTDAALGVELMSTLANIRRSTEPADDPLSNIALEVKDQIANAVGCRVGSPPDVLNRQSLDGLLDPRQVAIGQQLSGLIDERSRNLSHPWRFR